MGTESRIDLKAEGYIMWQGRRLELYDPDGMMLNGLMWYTFHIPGEDGLWEHCPATGQTIKTK